MKEDKRLQLDVGKRRAAVRLDGERVAAFDVRRVEVLDHRTAETVAAELDQSVGPVLVVLRRSSPEARALLRERRISYATAEGELFVFAPPVYLERPARRPSIAPPAGRTAPFAIRASRVPRWLLLHPDERPSFRELGHRVQLSEAMVSRTVRALADEGLLAIDGDPDDARVRRARLRDAPAMLDAFELSAAARRSRRLIWDVGARDADAALELWREAAKRLERPYAIGGLAGAALVRRAVEPAEVAVWIAREDIDAWVEELAAEPAHPGPGRLTAQLTPDPFVLSLTDERDGVRVADPVQLYLDCRLAGERALEAAAAIRSEMGW